MKVGLLKSRKTVGEDVPFSHRVHRTPIQPPGKTACAETSWVAPFMVLSGVESALVPSGEVKDPARTVPRAILLAMAGITLLYLALQLVAQGVLGATLATSKATPLADAAGLAIGGWARALLLVGATVSMFGYVSGMTLAIPRALYAFGRDGFLPAPIARIHPAFGTPVLAIVVQSAIVCATCDFSSVTRLFHTAPFGSVTERWIGPSA